MERARTWRSEPLRSCPKARFLATWRTICRCILSMIWIVSTNWTRSLLAAS